MNNIFIEIFDPAMSSLGFKRLGRIYHKMLSEQILVLLSYKVYSGGHEITIQFEIIPFCYGAPCTPHFLDYNWTLEGLRPFVDNSVITLHDKSNLVEVAQTFEILLSVSKQILFPWFAILIDYKNYMKFRNIPSLKELEESKKFDNIYLPLTTYIPVFLAVGKYAHAALALKASTISLQEFLAEMDRFSPAHPRYANVLDRIKHNENLLWLIEENDKTALQNIVRKDEQFSRASYYKAFKVKPL